MTKLPMQGEGNKTMSKIISKEEKVIVKQHSGGYREYRIPGILPVKDALLLTFEARNGEGEENLGDWGDIDIIVLRMEADGETVEVLRIGESALPKDGKLRTYNNPVLIPDGDRTHLIYHKNYDQVYIVTSEDGGKTWSDSREITDVYREFPYKWNVSATGPGHGIQMKSGRLVAPIWIANGKLYEDGTMRREHHPSIAGCVYSDDHGISWHAGALVGGEFCTNETSVTELEDGRLLFNCRNNEKRRMLVVSSDGGQTVDRIWWPEELQDPRCFGAVTACDEGVLFVNCDTTEKRVDLKVKLSEDAGETWKTVWEIDPVGGYADIAVAGDDVFVFYERTNYEAGGVIDELVLIRGSIAE